MQKEELEISEDTGGYRDKIATVDKQGKRIWIYPKQPSGRFYRARTWFSYLLLAALFSGPFIKIGGEPILLLNFLERKFVLFGLVFWPQDFHLFVLASISFMVFIVLFTAVFGRVWCGWACPQTVFMEMVFRKIEYLIEGDARQQRALNARPMDAAKFWRKALKQTIFFLIAFLIGNLAMAYIVGVERVLEIVTSPPSAHWSGFLAVMIFSLIFYGVFSYFREQACVIVCPYGRFQSVMLDKNSIVVSYDFERGEPRGKKTRSKPEVPKGDCVDCHLCVDVCPTGIDIRNGTQLECVNCTACMDACDAVMEKVKRPAGLIRYASYNGIVSGESRLLSPRVAAYSAVLTILIVTLFALLLGRSDIEATVLRTPGTLYQELADGRISNLYSLKIVNKTSDVMPIQVTLAGVAGEVELVGATQNVPPNGLLETAFFIKIAREALPLPGRRAELEISSNGKLLETVRTSFVSPPKLR